jgi:hypothetical protein
LFLSEVYFGAFSLGMGIEEGFEGRSDVYFWGKGNFWEVEALFAKMGDFRD